MNIGIGISLANYRPVPTAPLEDPDAAIAALFSGGEVGAWYDPSDSSTVWQDAAGTTPATVGDPVGRIDDKSGNGNHATQTTSAARPVLQSSGGLYYLDFDGVDDYLTTATFASGAQAQPNTIALAAELATTANVMHVDSEFGGLGGRHLYYNIGADLTLYTNTGVTYAGANDGSASTWVALFDGVSKYLRKNGIVQSPTSGTTVGTNTWSGITMGSRNTGAQNSSSNFYSFVGVNRTLTAGEIADLETYLAAKSGVTL